MDGPAGSAGPDDPADDPGGEGGEALALLDAARHLADRVWRSQAPPATRAAVAAELAALAERLGPFAEGSPPVNPGATRLPGRGNPLLAPLRSRVGDDGRLTGEVTFGRGHEGAGAVHGGQLALVFDELLGRATTVVTLARTATLTVHYRSLAPVGVPLAAEAWVDSTDGRKLRAVGRLLHGDTVCAEAEGLYIAVDRW
jgi:hypothetical protein